MTERKQLAWTGTDTAGKNEREEDQEETWEMGKAISERK